MGTSSSSGHSAGDGHTCLSQTPECRTHPKARLHLQAALQVKIICSHPQILSYSQPWLPCDFAWRAGTGGAELGEPPGPCSAPHPLPTSGSQLCLPLSLPNLGRGFTGRRILDLAFYFLGLLLLDYRKQWEDWVA